MSDRPRSKRRSALVTRKRAPVGAPPGTLVTHPGVDAPALHLIAFDKDTIDEIADATLEQVAAERARGRIVWLDVGGVGNADSVQRIGTAFGLDPLALEDVMNLHQRPKADEFDTFLYVVVHMMSQAAMASKEQFSLFLGDRFVLTFQEAPGDCLEPVRARLRRDHSKLRQAKADYLAYAILDTILDAYFPLAEKLGDRLEDLEETIIADPDPGQVTQLHEIKRELLALKRSLWPSRELIASLRNEDHAFFSRDTRRYLRDTHDHVMQLIDIVETYRELATSLMDLYVSSLSNRMNEVMKVLTIIATIFIPLSFLAGVWGMNFADMPELHWAHGYPAALALMAGTALALLGWFRWKKWF